MLDLANEWGLLAGNILADLGAGVIAVEPPGGSTARRLGPFRGDSGRPEDSLWWAAYGRNRRGITLNLETPEGRNLLFRLAKEADVLTESFAPGHLAALGLGFETLAAVNPRLIMASVTPFGQDGPKADWPASDLTVIAGSNFLLACGDKDRAPLAIPLPQSYLHASAEAATGVLVALRERRRSGLGQWVEVSAQQAMTNCTQSFVLAAAWGDVSFFRLPPGEMRKVTGLSGVYEAKDGFVVIGFFFGSGLGPIANKFTAWIYEEGMCTAADRDQDWVTFRSRMMAGEVAVEELERFHDIVEGFTRTKTKQELLAGALERGLLLSPAFTVADVLESPQLAHRKFWVHTGPDDGLRYPGPFARFSGSPLPPGCPAPGIGEHNAEILGGELGLTAAELRALAARGAI